MPLFRKIDICVGKFRARWTAFFPKWADLAILGAKCGLLLSLVLVNSIVGVWDASGYAICAAGVS